MDQSFFLISNSSPLLHPENTRSSFSNTLYKDVICSDKKVLIKLEYCIFNNTFRAFFSKRDEVADIIFRQGQYRETFKIQDFSTIEELKTQLEHFFQKCAFDLKISPKTFFKIILEDNKIILAFGHGEVLFSDLLVDILQLNQEMFKSRKDVKSGLFYNIIRSPGDNLQVAKSFYEMQYNERKLDFVNIECAQIKSYYGVEPEGCRKIIASVPVSNAHRSNYYFNFLNAFFEIDSTYFRELSIRFLQPNNQKVYFETGPPNILKFNTMMSSNTNEFFYLYVSSKATSHNENNSCSNFVYQIPRQYDLNGEWECCVVNAFIPRPQNFLMYNPTVYTIKEKDCYFGVCIEGSEDKDDYKLVEIPFQEFNRRMLFTFLNYYFQKYLNFFVDNNECLIVRRRRDLLFRGNILILTSQPILDIINTYQYIPVVQRTTENLNWKYAFRNMTMAIDTYDNLNDSQLVGGWINEEHYNNVKRDSNRFLIQPQIFYSLPDYVTFIETEMGLLETDWEECSKYLSFKEKHEYFLIRHLESKNVTRTREFVPSYLFVYADFIKESIIGDKMAHILKIIPYKNGQNFMPGGLFNFQTDEYYKVSKNCLKSLEFQIKTHSGQKYNYFPEDSTINLTLKFRRTK